MNVERAKVKIKEAGCSWEAFMRWMDGQTMGLGPDGKADIYDHDVDRFIRMEGDPGRETSAEFD